MSTSFQELAGRVALPRGIDVCRIGIGCWPIGGPDSNLGMPMGWSTADDTEARRGLDRAYELGANLFDTADVYGHGHSERLVGWLLSHVPRNQVAVASKVGYFAGTAPHAYDPRHMRRQLEQTLDNLGTDYIDIYSLHNANFGPDDRYLAGAIESMREFQQRGLIRAIGMRGPHRFAPERLSNVRSRADKHARFRTLFDVMRPDVLAVRYNLLTPETRYGGIMDFAAEHGVLVMINKPLGQGLLTGSYIPASPPDFGTGDHRARKRWFTQPALSVLHEQLSPLRERFGIESGKIVRVALRYCLQRSEHSVVLVGFTTCAQIEANLTELGSPLTDDDLRVVSEVGRRAQRELDALGEVFIDEVDREPDARPAGGR